MKNSEAMLEERLEILENYYLHGFMSKLSAVVGGVDIFIDDENEKALKIARESLSWLIDRYNKFNGSNSTAILFPFFPFKGHHVSAFL